MLPNCIASFHLKKVTSSIASGECISSTIASQLKIFFLRANAGPDEAGIFCS
jgi:hypothetical protein